jgi:hypothetical protein
LGAVEAASIGDEEIDGGRGQIEILSLRGISRRAAADGMLRQMDPVGGMHFLEFILTVEHLASKIQDHMSGIALHGLRSLTLDVDVAGQRGRAQQVLLTREQQLGLIGASTQRIRIFDCGLRVHVAPWPERAAPRSPVPERMWLDRIARFRYPAS